MGMVVLTMWLFSFLFHHSLVLKAIQRVINLKIVAAECQRLLQLGVSKYMCARSQSNDHYCQDCRDAREAGCPRLAVSWDYASLYQHPQPQQGSFRNARQQDLFQQALSGLACFYSHPHVFRLKVTKFPEKYPEGILTNSSLRNK